MRSCPEFERMLVRSGIILIKYWFSVSDEEQEQRFRARIKRSDQVLEAEPHGCRVAQSLGPVLEGQGRDVQLHGHQAGPLVRGGSRRQETGPPQLHPAPAEHGPVRRPETATEIELPPRPDASGYVRPPLSDQTFVPDYYE